MKIRTKLFWWMSLIGIAVVVVNALTLVVILRMQPNNEELLRHTAPSLTVLGQIKADGLGLSEASFGISLRQNESILNSDLVREEQEEFDARKQKLLEGEQRYVDIYADDVRAQNDVTLLSGVIDDLLIDAETVSKSDLNSPTYLIERERFEETENAFEVFLNLLIANEELEFQESAAAIRGSTQLVTLLSLFSLLVIPLVAFIIAFRLAAWLTRPLRELSEAALRLGEGDFQIQVPVISNDELGILGETFNQMVTRLNQITISRDNFEAIFHNVPSSIIIISPDQRIETVNKFTARMLGYEAPDKLEGKSYLEVLAQPDFDHADLDDSTGFIEVAYLKQNGDRVPVSLRGNILRSPRGDLQRIICSAVDISERKRMQRELLEQERENIELQKARQLDDFKRRFMSMISHEFRTPLAIINNACHILRYHDERLVPEKRDDHWQRISEQVKRLSEMMDDVSRVMKGEKALIPFNPQPIDLLSVCQVIIDDVQATVGNQHKLVFHAQNTDRIFADEALIKQIVLNLISNAVKYSPVKTEITISLLADKQEVVLEVTDHGMGIPEAEQKYLFTPYFRGSNVENLIQGTGLGLRIVLDAVKLHSGRIDIKSRLGLGTTIRIFLPQNSTLGSPADAAEHYLLGNTKDNKPHNLSDSFTTGFIVSE